MLKVLRLEKCEATLPPKYASRLNAFSWELFSPSDLKRSKLGKRLRELFQLDGRDSRREDTHEIVVTTWAKKKKKKKKTWNYFGNPEGLKFVEFLPLFGNPRGKDAEKKCKFQLFLRLFLSDVASVSSSSLFSRETCLTLCCAGKDCFMFNTKVNWFASKTRCRCQGFTFCKKKRLFASKHEIERRQTETKK